MSILAWTVVAALGAAASALCAAVYTYLTYRLVRTQSEPNVVIYVRHDQNRPTIIEIVVENIGRGLASDLRFRASRPIPSQALGLAVADAEPAATMVNGPLIDGIRALGPGDSRRITWGQYGGLMNALGNDAIDVTCSYKHGTREMPPVTGHLEVRSFTGTHVTRSDSVMIVEALREIVEAINNPSKISNWFPVPSHNLEKHSEP